MKIKFTSQCWAAFAGLASFLVTFCPLAHGQSNILYNGSFEETNTLGWDGGITIRRGYGAQGINLAEVQDSMWQDVPTIPGWVYLLSFANMDCVQPSVRVWWGDIAITNLTTVPPNYYGLWYHQSCALPVAVSNTTRLRFEKIGSYLRLDDIRVGWADEPVSVQAQPQGASGMEGGTVTFSIQADGGPPLYYQWQFQGAVIPGARGATLTLTNVDSSQAGNYSVVVSNHINVLTSQTVVLQVDPVPHAPLLLVQPQSHSVPAGYAASLAVVAAGTAPLSYQWFTNGIALSNATNTAVVFNPVGASNAANYSVLVSNHHGTVLSLVATLLVTPCSGGGAVAFNNLTAIVNAPFFDSDGVTKLAGSNFLAQMYAGATNTALRPVGATAPFRTGSFAGYFVSGNRTIPDVASGQTAYAQIRVWEAARGRTYEEARARGGKFGASGVYAVTTRPVTGPFLPLTSFSLRAGLPLFVTGVLSRGDRLPDHTIQWVLTGSPGFLYLVEKKHPPQDWSPLVIVTNTTGVATFTDPDQSNSSVNFYRSRILD